MRKWIVVNSFPGEREMKLYNYLNEANKKYPRTYHMPWSEEIHSDDKTYDNMGYFLNKPLAISIKMDGSNVGLSFETVSSRSGDYPGHPSFDMLKQKYFTIKHDIPKNMIIYGEWLYAVHSIEYDDLDDYFVSFAILENGKWLSVKEVIEWSELLGLKTVKYIKRNIKFTDLADMKEKTTEMAKSVIKSGHEGIVMRLEESFLDLTKNTVKYVRSGHVQTDKHWSFQKIKVQKVKEK